jgi:hypothetical protein
LAPANHRTANLIDTLACLWSQAGFGSLLSLDIDLTAGPHDLIFGSIHARKGKGHGLMSTTYYPHEIRRHTRAIKDGIQRACTIVFPEPNIAFQLKNSLGWLWKPAQHVKITVMQKTGHGHRKPICVIDIDREAAENGTYSYQKASAAFLDGAQHAGNTRLLGHLHRHCPFLPHMKVTLAYELQAQ